MDILEYTPEKPPAEKKETRKIDKEVDITEFDDFEDDFIKPLKKNLEPSKPPIPKAEVLLPWLPLILIFVQTPRKLDSFLDKTEEISSEISLYQTPPSRFIDSESSTKKVDKSINKEKEKKRIDTPKPSAHK